MFGILLIFTLVASACSTTTVTTSEEDIVIPVQVANVETGQLKEEKKIIGSAAPNLQISVYSELSGKLAEVRVKKGGKVEKGQIIAVLNQGDYNNTVIQAEAQLKSAKANLAQAEAGRSSSIVQTENQWKQAKAAYDSAKINVDRMKSLYEEEAVSKQQLEQAENGLVQAEVSLNIAKESYENANRTENLAVIRAQLETAQAGLNNAKHNFDKTYMKAPASGTIVQLGADVGELVSPQMPVATIIDIQTIIVNAMLSEDELKYAQAGEEIDTYLNVFDQKQKGTVTFVSPIADTQTKNYPIEVQLNNQEETIKPGMIVELSLQDTETAEEVLVPVNALVKQGEEVFVFVVNGDTVEKRTIRIKEEGIEKASIIEGLQEDEVVVVKGQMNLEDGDHVRILDGGGN